MKIKPPITDKALIDMVLNQLIDNKEKYSDAYAASGHLFVHERALTKAIDRGKGHVTSEVLGEIVETMCVLIKMAREYQHN